jgi:hypothetical protein
MIHALAAFVLLLQLPLLRYRQPESLAKTVRQSLRPELRPRAHDEASEVRGIIPSPHSTKKGCCQDPIYRLHRNSDATVAIALKNHQFLFWWLFQKGCPRRAVCFSGFEPAYAGGNLPIGSALPFQATASPLELNSRFSRCWLKTVAASRTQQGPQLYTNTKLAKRQIFPIGVHLL